MDFLLLSLTLFFAGGLAALAAKGNAASRIGAVSAVAASAAGLVPATRMAAQALLQRPADHIAITLAKLPMGNLALSLDLLSAVFCIPVLILTAVAALYGMGNGDSGKNGSHAGAHWFFYNLLAGGMVLTLTAADAFLFLVAWEIMSVAPFFLIIMNGEDENTRKAAWTYLVAAHIGVLFLLAFFALLASAYDGDLSFRVFAAQNALREMGLHAPGGAGMLFLFALIGFGAKSGFMPLHVWLPEAHPAAPSHVSALMSGAMIKMGVYGFLRALMFLGSGEAWWAYVLMGIGAFTAFSGILQALAQSAIKKALAFSSVENIGIIFLGLGIALLCLQNGHINAAALAAAGSLLHTLNHALSKGMLFLCAGSVLHGAGTETLRHLGGLQKRMPLVGWCFLAGSAALAALPPLNGFAGEFLIYLGMIFGGMAFAHGPSPEYSLAFWACLFALAGAGGFTLLAFARLFGIAFLGEPRSREAAAAHGPRNNEIAAIALLAFLCVASALSAPKIAGVCHAAVTPLLYGSRESVPPALAAAPARLTPVPHLPAGLAAPNIGKGEIGSAIGLLREVNGVFLLLAAFGLAAWQIRRRLLRGREIASSPTWDCGYIAPTPRMQYSAGSFSRLAAFFMRTVLRQQFTHTPIPEYFPLAARAKLTTEDWIATKGFAPLFMLAARVADWCKILQHGRSNGYILYILVTVVALLAWHLG